MNHLVQLLKVTARTLVVRAAALYPSLFAFMLQYMQRICYRLMLQTQKEGHETLLQCFRRKCLDRFSRLDISGEESHELSTGYFTQIY